MKNMDNLLKMNEGCAVWGETFTFIKARNREIGDIKGYVVQSKRKNLTNG